jgi:hypothetical protein
MLDPYKVLKMIEDSNTIVWHYRHKGREWVKSKFIVKLWEYDDVLAPYRSIDIAIQIYFDIVEKQSNLQHCFIISKQQNRYF